MLPDKVILTFKTNDVIDQLDLPEESDEGEEGINPKKWVKHQLEKWIEYGEYIRIEFDLENETAKVLESR